MSWLHVAESFGGRIGMPLLVWTGLTVLSCLVLIVMFLRRRDSSAYFGKMVYLTAIVLLWAVHLFVTLYTVMNLYAFKLVIFEEGGEQSFAVYWMDCLQMHLLGTLCAIVNSCLLTMLCFEVEHLHANHSTRDANEK
jgi:hypothetical protein